MPVLALPVQQGKELVEQCRFDEARQHFQDLSAKADYHLEAEVWLGRLDLMMFQLDTALAHLDSVLEIQPNHAEALALKAACHMESEEYEEAVRLLETARQ